MTTDSIGKAISALVTSSTILVVVLFGNFMLRRTDGTVWGVSLPSRSVHFILGPVLVTLNSVLLVYLCALYKMESTPKEITDLRSMQKYHFFGFLANPFYVSKNQAITAVGYAFLIVLWWLGMYTFLYSLGLNVDSPWLFGWQVLISVIYLALGLASMLAIQACWSKFDITVYRWKMWAAFVGIPIGAFLPPLLLRLGIPKISLFK